MKQEQIFDFIKKTINSENIVLFMKGTANFPQCGFSSFIVQMLQSMNVKFKDINVLENDALREGIKKYTNWPTIPQLYIKGEFVGGADIAKEMYKSGELSKLIENCKS